MHMNEEKTLSDIAKAGLTILTVMVELVMTYILLILNALPALMRGYWMVFYVPIIAWVFVSLLWCYGMYRFICKRKKKEKKRRR